MIYKAMGMEKTTVEEVVSVMMNLKEVAVTAEDMAEMAVLKKIKFWWLTLSVHFSIRIFH